MTNVIKITIEGPTGSGKSAIGELIRNLLCTHALRVTYTDLVDDQEPMRGPINLGICLSMLSERGTKIEIVEKQGRRDL